MSARRFPFGHEGVPLQQAALPSIDPRQTLPEGTVTPRPVLPFRAPATVQQAAPLRPEAQALPQSETRRSRWGELRWIVLGILILVADALVIWALLRRP